MHVLIFGLGYTGEVLARRLQSQGVPVAGTRTDAASPSAVALTAQGIPIVGFDGMRSSSDFARLIEQATHVVVSIPPDRSAEGKRPSLPPSGRRWPEGPDEGARDRPTGAHIKPLTPTLSLRGEGAPNSTTAPSASATDDPVLRWYGDNLASAPNLKWIGYLSTVGVYGDRGGEWINEDSEPLPTSPRSRQRLDIEKQWLEFGRSSDKRVEIFRIAGIYGPGRSAIDNLRSGTARRIIKPGQVFNRIHVDDIAAVLEAAMRRPSNAPHHIFNLADDEPSPASDVVTYAALLIGVEPPPEVAFEVAGLSTMAASFYSECKRVRNERLKTALGVKLAYPTYREGMNAIAARLSTERQ